MNYMFTEPSKERPLKHQRSVKNISEANQKSSNNCLTTQQTNDNSSGPLNKDLENINMGAFIQALKKAAQNTK